MPGQGLTCFIVKVADLHIHSRYSRATAKNLDPEHLWLFAQLKGIHLLGTGDFTHPAWFAELSEKLAETGDGAYELKPEYAAGLGDMLPPACASPVRFLLSGEISSIYKRHGKTRKVHSLILMPDLASVERLNTRLDKLGNIKSDGRPILGLDARDLLELCLEVEPSVIFIPAHIWTPWFSLFGSKSGFDAIEECFDDLTPHIHALETGLSSDPPMNWRVSALDRYTLVSNSDAHSPAKLAREANLLSCELSYQALAKALADPAGGGFAGTLEFYPDEGKYHLDGHRKCGVRLTPSQTREAGGLCPVCGRPLTVGVMSRVEDLADRPEGAKPEGVPPFESVVPLAEVISEVVQKGPATKTVQAGLGKLRAELGPELFILREAPLDEIAKLGGPVLAEAMERVRTGRMRVEGGYDGEFGVVKIFSSSEREELKGQGGFWDLKPARKPRGKKAATLAAKPATQPAFSLTAPEPDDGGLNPEQDRAASCQGGHLIVRAGPGSGKTRLLVSRLEGLLAEGVPARGILALTFTNKAAGEMASRLQEASPLAGEVRVSTFHALGLEVLRRALGQEPVLLTPEEREALLAGLAKERGLKPSELDLAVTRSKQGIREEHAPELAEGIAAYGQALAALGKLDLDDLVLKAGEVLAADESQLAAWRDGLAHILVDEYQDVNPVQAELLRLLAGAGAAVCAIGDPDQAIYGFRGADKRLFRRFAADFPGAKLMGLSANYRSSGSILALSRGLMAADPDPDRVELSPRKPAGPLPTACGLASPRAEARWVAEKVVELLGGLDSRQVEASDQERAQAFSAGDIAVLYRLHAQAPALVEALEQAGVPVQVASREPLAETDPLDFKAQRVSLLSMHAAKGLEWPVVFVTGLERGLLPYEPPNKEAADTAEERRLLYVALTRAEERLYLSWAAKRGLFGQSMGGASCFLAEIPDDLTQKEKPAGPRKRTRQLELF